MYSLSLPHLYASQFHSFMDQLVDLMDKLFKQILSSLMILKNIGYIISSKLFNSYVVK